MRDMSLKKPARPAGVLLRYRTESPPAGKGLQLSGALVVVVGLLLLSLAAGDALAGDDALRGSGVGDRLAGFGEEDRMRGLAGKDGLSGGGGDDELYGGQGRDALLGGKADDFLETKDGERTTWTADRAATRSAWTWKTASRAPARPSTQPESVVHKAPRALCTTRMSALQLASFLGSGLRRWCSL